ncbi:MAG: SMI1/KNR4 family protein [Acidobacteriota bacterium]
MLIIEILKDESAKWDRSQPAPETVIQSLLEQSGLELPDDYISFLRCSNGGEGELGIQPWWFRVWTAEEVLEANRGYEVQTNIPGFFGFGSSGGGELLAFDARAPKRWPVFMIPFIVMDEKDAVRIADDFSSFVMEMGRSTEGV